MNIVQAKQLIKLGYEIKRGVILIGQPGNGKSAAIYQCAEELSDEHNEDFGMIEMRGSTLNPAETADIKYIVKGKVKDAPQNWVPTAERVKAGACPARGLIFLDEIGDSMMSIQSVLQRLFLDRKLGSLTLADGWQCVAATNRAKDKAAAGRLSTALINRCIVATVTPDPDVFYNWGIDNGIDYRILSFVRFRPECVNDFDPGRRSENMAFCSPRSLEIASDTIKGFEDFSEALKIETISGILGDGVGSEFSGFLRVMDDLPDLSAILKDPKTYPVTTKVDVAYATIGALIHLADDKNLEKIVIYFTRFGTELSIVALTDLMRINEAAAEIPEFIKWASKNLKYVN